MHYIESPGLSRLSALLNGLDVGDRILTGRLELFCTSSHCEYANSQIAEHKLNAKKNRRSESPRKNEVKRNVLNDCSVTNDSIAEHTTTSEDTTTKATETNSNKNGSSTSNEQENLSVSKTHEELDSCSSSKKICSKSDDKSDNEPMSQPQIDMVENVTKKRKKQQSSSFWDVHECRQNLLAQIMMTMNACFPDYDFTAVIPDVFHYVEDVPAVYAAINYHLSFLVENVIPGFLQDLWFVIKDVVDLNEIAIYNYSNTQGHVDTDPYLDDEGCLFSFNYFFVDSKNSKILFFFCMTKQKPPPVIALESLNDYGYDSQKNIDTDYQLTELCLVLRLSLLRQRDSEHLPNTRQVISSFFLKKFKSVKTNTLHTNDDTHSFVF